MGKAAPQPTFSGFQQLFPSLLNLFVEVPMGLAQNLKVEYH